jgi:hypothetical protein
MWLSPLMFFLLADDGNFIKLFSLRPPTQRRLIGITILPYVYLTNKNECRVATFLWTPLNSGHVYDEF